MRFEKNISYKRIIDNRVIPDIHKMKTASGNSVTSFELILTPFKWNHGIGINFSIIRVSDSYRNKIFEKDLFDKDISSFSDIIFIRVLKNSSLDDNSLTDIASILFEKYFHHMHEFETINDKFNENVHIIVCTAIGKINKNELDP
jgi:hypothetical protein